MSPCVHFQQTIRKDLLFIMQGSVRMKSERERTRKKKAPWPWGGSSPPCLLAIFVIHIVFSHVVCSSSGSSNSQQDSFLPGGRIDHLQLRNFDVNLQIQQHQAIVGNGFLEVTFGIPDGDVLGIKYRGVENLLSTSHDSRGYFDVNWDEPSKSSNRYSRIRGTKFRIIMQNKDQVELSFKATWDHTQSESIFPMNVDKRYVVLKGVSGFYAYSIFERLREWPDMTMYQTRMVFKLHQQRFRYMAVSDDRQRIMPTERDREYGEPLAFPEAVILTHPSSPALRGEVDDKYQYSSDNKDSKVHGWICFEPPIGLWLMTPSNEFRSGGPMKQDLTSHVGPTLLSMLASTHYAGTGIDSKFRNGKPWKKVFGPVFIYLNTNYTNHEKPTELWEDAKAQLMKEVDDWPYEFPVSSDYPKLNQRGSVSGRLLVCDGCKNQKSRGASNAYIGLAAPGEAGSWQWESLGYQFWVKADKQGRFLITGVRAGVYNLYAWVPGNIGDYRLNQYITVSPGSKINLGTILYAPPRDGPTLWQIGIPDRTASEFFVPEAEPTLVNKLYSQEKANRFRQYGLWDRYAKLFPNKDLAFTIGASIYNTDWFFAQVNRKMRDNTYQGTTWQIIFQLQNVTRAKIYMLRIALASASEAELQVRFNYPNTMRPHFTTGLIGKDNAIARHAIHGLYRLFNVEVSGSLLQKGNNTIFLTQTRGGSPFRGIMYDYIRLEGPPI